MRLMHRVPMCGVIGALRGEPLMNRFDGFS
jgi:hypothetical protein